MISRDFLCHAFVICCFFSNTITITITKMIRIRIRIRISMRMIMIMIMIMMMMIIIIAFIIWLGPRTGKMNQIARCNWLPERAGWSHLARSGLPAESRK